MPEHVVGALASVKNNWHVLCIEAIIQEVSILMGQKAFDYLRVHTSEVQRISV